MLFNATVLAVISLVGFYIIYLKLPVWVRKLMIKVELLVDATACILTYMLFSGAVTGLIAGGLVGIGTSLILKVERKKMERKEGLANA